jgi:hypothetical protein
LGILVGAHASAANILINPGFETGDLTGWTTSGYGVNSDANTGNWAAWSNGNVWVRQNFAAVSTALITEVSVWTKQPNVGATYFFAMDFFYSDSSTEQFIPGGSSSGGYAKIDVTSQLDAGKSLTGIAAWGYSSGNPNSDITLHDDFMVNVVPEPATGLVLLAGAAVAALRRRRHV